MVSADFMCTLKIAKEALRVNHSINNTQINDRCLKISLKATLTEIRITEQDMCTDLQVKKGAQDPDLSDISSVLWDAHTYSETQTPLLTLNRAIFSQRCAHYPFHPSR